MQYSATLIRLPKKTIEALKIRAAKERLSLAQLVRDAIEQTYHIEASEKTISPKDDPFYRLIGAWQSGRKSGARDHDREIYGGGD